MLKLIYASVGLAVMVSSTSLYAQDNQADTFKKLLKKFDKNGDGKLDADEREALRAELLKQAPNDDPDALIRERRTPREIARDRRRVEIDARRRQFELLYDQNGDGELSDEERDDLRAEFDKRREQRRQEFMERYDKNDDGEIDDAEREALRADGERRRAEFMRQWDKDGNGDIDEQEREAIRAEREKRRDELNAKYDKNKDGILSFEERDKAREDGAFEDGGFPFFGPPGFGGPIGIGGPGIVRPEGGRRGPRRREGNRR